MRATILEGLTAPQAAAVQSQARKLLLAAGAGSGKTEVMARRIAWSIGVDGHSRDEFVVFTFTEKAAEELRFRVRQWVQTITPAGQDATLGKMYVGTIHGFCLRALRELDPDTYHNFDILDEAARACLVHQHYRGTLGLNELQDALGALQFATVDTFLHAWDLLHEFDVTGFQLPATPMPRGPGREEREWCQGATVVQSLGTGRPAQAFAAAAARMYAFQRVRHFVDFSSSQTELVHLLANESLLSRLRASYHHVFVDEVQDINPVQKRIIDLIVGDQGRLTAVGDHRQAIYAWRGGRVQIMADMKKAIQASKDGAVLELPHNFRSTPRIISASNKWASTISRSPNLPSPDMTHGRKARVDYDAGHVAVLRFPDRPDEARWIAQTIRSMVAPGRGARHDAKANDRGLSFSDIAVLVRSSTDARTYMAALQAAGVPAVVKAGPDLFSQPEVLLFTGVLGLAADVDQFYGSPSRPASLPARIADVLGCGPEPPQIITHAAAALRQRGMPLDADVERRLGAAGRAIRARLAGEQSSSEELALLRSADLRKWLTKGKELKRVFPQELYHLLLEEAGVHQWDSAGATAAGPMFHLGQLSSLIKQFETPGWVTPRDVRYLVIALCSWGADNARSAEAPLLAQPDAVTVTTVHSAKGLEFGAVFLADVCAQRFPSHFARRLPDLPFDGPALARIDPAALADSDNVDGERRLMYVAMTRAERYLYISASGERTSAFMRELTPILDAAGARIPARAITFVPTFQQAEQGASDEARLVTSFSDLRYYIECPHDFYLRKVLGFAPTIDQAFGYGRGVHNILRAIHSDPKKWAKLANTSTLRDRLKHLVEESGLFYLRYTVKDPLVNMQGAAVAILERYINRHHAELAKLAFEPEREFETLLPGSDVLISGSIDVVRLDDPPRVAIIDFKSGTRELSREALDEDLMRLQVMLYGMAAKRELSYEPGKGLVRYLGKRLESGAELDVPLDPDALAEAERRVMDTTKGIRDRQFATGPSAEHRGDARCGSCDFLKVCGRPEAQKARAAPPDATGKPGRTAGRTR